MLFTRHYPDVDSASDWLKIYFHQSEVLKDLNTSRHQCGISALIPQTSFRGETVAGVAKSRLFSQPALHV